MNRRKFLQAASGCSLLAVAAAATHADTQDVSVSNLSKPRFNELPAKEANDMIRHMYIECSIDWHNNKMTQYFLESVVLAHVAWKLQKPMSQCKSLIGDFLRALAKYAYTKRCDVQQALNGIGTELDRMHHNCAWDIESYATWAANSPR